MDERTPVILEVPEITGRYYTAQILDEWGEVISNINERTFPSMPFGKFALVPQVGKGSFPRTRPASNCTRMRRRCSGGSSSEASRKAL
ncbi:DUF1254 domain-containing protein [Agrobacterium pusense]|uniref:DUF1254 domain-containing protein n=1 Tax=Agrobacterium pusense TaxID=648995 RepID=UPI00245355F5|nr:DUF1254 domain-containing protein [Agrobacterium pusense]